MQLVGEGTKADIVWLLAINMLMVRRKLANVIMLGVCFIVVSTALALRDELKIMWCNYRVIAGQSWLYCSTPRDVREDVDS